MAEFEKFDFGRVKANSGVRWPLALSNSIVFLDPFSSFCRTSLTDDPLTLMMVKLRFF